MNDAPTARANRRLALQLGATAVAMFGFGYLLVPLYDVFCEVVGLDRRGLVQAAEVVPSVRQDRLVTVEFVAIDQAGGGWEFAPTTRSMQVHPGELTGTTFRARNVAGAARIAQAVPNVAPMLAAAHFRKTECFCFTPQPFAAGEARELVVRFVVDPALPAEVEVVTLAYTFYGSAARANANQGS
jgi:cytochrome c oxidase assembly protein subunit 11